MTNAITNTIVVINNAKLPVREYNGKRVVTFSDIDNVHERPAGTARKRFNDNRKHFIEGEDFYKVCPSEIRTHKIADISNKAREDLTLITETGYLMLTKSLTDDLSWKIQRQLVNRYFKTTDTAMVTITPEIAKAMLEVNNNNRGISPTNVQRMADDMLSGNFRLNGETIKVYEDGTLADGQHRLMACVTANVPFQTYIVRGIKKDVLPTIDAGKARNVVQSLNMTGCGINSYIIGAMNYYFNYGNRLSANQVRCLWDAYQLEIEFITKAIKKFNKDNVISEREFKAMCLHLMLSENWYEDEILNFIEGMSEKPNRNNNFELTCYYYRQWYNKKIYKKCLNTGNSWTQFNQYARAIDALVSVAKAYRTGKVVKTFPWKDRAKGIVDTGFALANQHYQTIGMTKTNMIERK